MAGAVIGLVFGTLICLLQEKYGLITLGDGSYIITAYPVKIVFEDILSHRACRLIDRLYSLHISR